MSENLRTNTAVWLEKYQRWQIKVQKDGIRKTFTSTKKGRTGQRECNAKADKWLELGNNSGKRSIESLYQEYQERTFSANSNGVNRNIESCFRTRILPPLGYKKIADISDGDIQQLINDMVSDGLSKKTITNYRNILSAFFKWCRLNNYSTYEMQAVEIPKSVRYKGKTVLQPKDLKTLFSVDTTLYRGQRVKEKYIYSFRFLCASGLRLGEMRGLEWSDIDGGYINITKAINVGDEVTSGKNENALRSVPITTQMQELLEAQKALKLNTSSVFDLPLYSTYYKIWQRYCRSNNIQPISLYELRHTYISIIKNLPVGEVKELVGHSVNMDTYGVYGHTLNGEAEKTAANVSAIFDTLLNENSKQAAYNSRLEQLKSKLSTLGISAENIADIITEVEKIVKVSKLG